MRVGYIGLGAMGGALARHLVEKSTLSVLDLNKAAVAEFEKLGARPASSAMEMARTCDVVVLCLPRSADVEKVIFGDNGLAAGLSAGKVVVDQTSGVPAETREFARRLAERGVSMFDAPVSGPMATAVAGTISIMASGPADAVDRALPVLNAMSRNVFRCGERVGSGQTIKAINNMMNVGCRLAALEAVAMGRKQGLSLETMIEALNASAARNHTTRGLLPAMLEGRQTVKFFLALQVKDMNQALALGEDRDVCMPMATLCRGLLQIGLNALGRDAQLEQIIGVIESMAGTQFVNRAASYIQQAAKQ